MNVITDDNREMIHFLQRYISLDTSHPNPDYESVCRLFTEQAVRDGFSVTRVQLASKKPVIVISYEGVDPSLSSLILNHHMDVVPATNHDAWVIPPFSGDIYNGSVVGRGAQDAKGLGVIHYYALKQLKDARIAVERTIHLVIVPDEEIGGFTGTQQFIETDFFKQMNAGFIIDEGVPSGDKEKIFIKIAERRPLQIRITTQGASAHGSKLSAFNAVHELVAILHELTGIHHEQQKQRNNTPDGLLLSVQITSLSAGVSNNGQIALNIIPESASATVDIRIPPTLSNQDVIDLLEKMMSRFEHSYYTLLATVADYQQDICSETDLYNALAHSIKECGLSPQQFHFEATTDVRFYKSLGLDGVGCTPFVTHDALHTTNESVPIEDLVQAKNIMVCFLKNFCNAKGKQYV
jgi:aminoacylase